MNNNNNFFEAFEKKAKKREEKKQKEKEMKTSGRSVFDIQKKIIIEKQEDANDR
jgi:hypothetical protein